MPIYEYVCPRCGAQPVERLISRAEDADTQRHYPCGQLMVRRPSSPAFSVKGWNEKNGYGARSK
jgi:putative FmdB family regulatory protein